MASTLDLAAVELAANRLAAIAEWSVLLRPFVGAKLTRQPRTSAVDILGGGAERIDCDIRGVTVAGVEVFFYSGCELIPWARVREIRFRALDDFGDTLATCTFEGRPAAVGIDLTILDGAPQS